jgi:hypothetical protein
MLVFSLVCQPIGRVRFHFWGSVLLDQVDSRAAIYPVGKIWDSPRL